MTYVALSVPFLVFAAAAALLLPRHLGSRARRLHWSAIALTVLGLFVLTAIFDSLMIGSGLFFYAEDHLWGPRIGLAPVEDFSYPLAAALLLPGLWVFLTKRKAKTAAMGDATTAWNRQLLVNACVASRPVSWINTAYPFAAALLLTTGEISWVLIVGIIYYLIPYNLAMYGINDVFDYESDLRNPRKGGLEGALLAPKFHKPTLWLSAITNIPFLVALCIAGGPSTWVAIAISTFALVAYSAPPMRFKERPVLDSITSSTHFFSPALVGLTLGGAEFNLPLILTLIAFGFWGMAAHAFGAVQDIGPDREAGIHSIATAFGAKATVRFAFVLWLSAGIMMLFTPWPGPLAAIVAIPYLLICMPYLALSDEQSERTNAAWKRFIWLNYGSGFVVTMIIILALFQGGFGG